MSLDSDVAAVLDGSRRNVRGILRLPSRAPPSYSAIASRQTLAPTAPHTQPAVAQAAVVAVVMPQPWQTVAVKRRGDKQEPSAVQAADDSVAEDGLDDSRSEAKRRRKKKAGEPPPPNLHFAELLDAQLRRLEENKKKPKTVDTSVDETSQPSASTTVDSDTPASGASNHSAPTVITAVVSSKRAKPTKLKRQMRHQQLHAFIRDSVLVPTVQAAVALAHSRQTAAGTESLQVEVVGEEVSEQETESERRERERKEKKRMLRQLKRKQKWLDKHAGDVRSVNPSQLSASHPSSHPAPNGDVKDEKQQKQDTEECDADDGSVVVESLLPLSQPVDVDEDPSCPTRPYNFTDEERAFLFQHVVVDRYHTQPPLSTLVSALCQQLFTPSVDSPVAHLLLALASYQRRALSSPSPLVRARGRRMVMGLREATKRLKQNRLLLLVLPHNVETAHPLLASQLTALYFQCVSRHVDVVWSLSRRRLADCCGVKGRVAVVGVVSGEGCSELMRGVRERVKEAREAWELRGWDVRVEPEVRERREREEAERELARREWQERETEARREEKKKEKARLEKEMEEAAKRDELLRLKQAERRLEQQRQAAVRREADELREQQRIAEEAEKAKRKLRQERTKAAVREDESGRQAVVGREGKTNEAVGGKKTWLEEAVERKEAGSSERVSGGGKQGKVKGKAGTTQGKTRR